MQRLAVQRLVVQQLEALVQQLVACCGLALGMHEGTDAHVAAVTAEIVAVAKGAAEQQQVGSKPRVQLQRYLAAILLAEVDKLRSLDAGSWSKAVKMSLAAAMVPPPDTPAVHALRGLSVLPGSGIRSGSVLEQSSAQQAQQGAEVLRQVVVEVRPLVVKEVDRKFLMAWEGFADCLRARMDRTARAELAEEAERHPVLDGRTVCGGLPADTRSLAAGIRCTARLYRKKAVQAET